MASHVYQGVCYPDDETTIDAVKASFPQLSSGHLVTLENPSITLNFLNGSLKDTTTNATTSFQAALTPCATTTQNATFDKTASNDIDFIGFLVVVFVGGFLSGKLK